MRTISDVKRDLAKVFEKLDELEAEARVINITKWQKKEADERKKDGI